MANKGFLDFGEDLQQIALRAYDLAHDHCDGCRDYHILWPYHRMAGNVGGVDSDRPELVPILRDLTMDMSFPHWLIAGAGDTGILATLVTALADMHTPANGYRVTVIDRCRTPLILCEEYGRQHDIELDTYAGDLTGLPFRNRFDGILLHSLFSFIENDARENHLKVLRRSLKPGGKLVFCSRYGEGAKFTTNVKERIDTYIDSLTKGFKTEVFRLPEEEGIFFQRVQRQIGGVSTTMPGSFDSADEMTDLLQTGGFTVNSVVHSGSAVRPGTMAQTVRPKRVIITATRVAA